MMQRALASRLAKPCVFLLALLPLGYWLTALFQDALGANPAEALLRGTGLWTLRMLCVLLLVSPLREITGWVGLARLRRLIAVRESSQMSATQSRVIVELDGIGRIEKLVTQATGGPDRPLSREQLQSKFVQLCGAERDGAALFERCLAIAELGDVADLAAV